MVKKITGIVSFAVLCSVLALPMLAQDKMDKMGGKMDKMGGKMASHKTMKKGAKKTTKKAGKMGKMDKMGGKMDKMDKMGGKM